MPNYKFFYVGSIFSGVLLINLNKFKTFFSQNYLDLYVISVKIISKWLIFNYAISKFINNWRQMLCILNLLQFYTILLWVIKIVYLTIQVLKRNLVAGNFERNHPLNFTVRRICLYPFCYNDKA